MSDNEKNYHHHWSDYGLIISDPTDVFYISEYEARTIVNWIKENEYTLSLGYFELRLHFGRFLLPAELLYHQKKQTYTMKVNVGYYSRNDISTPVGQILIDDVIIDLKLSTETWGKYEQSVNAFDHDSRLRFEIHKKSYYIFADKKLIATRNYKSHLDKSCPK